MEGRVRTAFVEKEVVGVDSAAAKGKVVVGASREGREESVGVDSVKKELTGTEIFQNKRLK